jgi:hypothetical protein
MLAHMRCTVLVIVLAAFAAPTLAAPRAAEQRRDRALAALPKGAYAVELVTHGPLAARTQLKADPPRQRLCLTSSFAQGAMAARFQDGVGTMTMKPTNGPEQAMRVQFAEIADEAHPFGVGVQIAGVGLGPGADLVTSLRRALTSGRVQAGKRANELVVDIDVDAAFNEFVANAGSSLLELSEEDAVSFGELAHQSSRMIFTLDRAHHVTSFRTSHIDHDVHPVDVDGTEAARAVQAAALRLRNDPERLAQLRAGFARGYRP